MNCPDPQNPNIRYNKTRRRPDQYSLEKGRIIQNSINPSLKVLKLLHFDGLVALYILTDMRGLYILEDGIWRCDENRFVLSQIIALQS
jgi:hypothetical protein